MLFEDVGDLVGNGRRLLVRDVTRIEKIAAAEQAPKITPSTVQVETCVSGAAAAAVVQLSVVAATAAPTGPILRI
jgi:hypothetical protein